MTEQIWISKCQKGHKQSFEPIFQQYCRKAYLAALSITGNPEDALDASQDAFIRAYRNIGKFDASRSFYPWFYRILKNCCFTLLAKRKKNITRDEIEQEDIKLNPALLVEKNESQEQIIKVINALPFQDREILQMKFIQGLRYQEMAEILEIPIGTVMSRLYTARSRLKEKLSHHFLEEVCP